MATYCIEKYESDGGEEVRVYWSCSRHVHNTALITSIKQWLGATRGGNWDVRINSYQSNQSAAPAGGIEYTG